MEDGMGWSTFMEVNHDTASLIRQSPAKFGELVERYTHGADSEIAAEIERRYGVKIWISSNRNGEWEERVRNVMRDPF